MKIGIIGAGNVGTGLAKQLVPKGHSVMLSFSRDSAELKAAATRFGSLSGSVSEAVQFGDLVVLATPWAATVNALAEIKKRPQRKILWDCTNVLRPDMHGLLIGTTTSGGEEVAKLAPWANVVKAIPPFAELLHSPSQLIGGRRPSVFVCGDDADARSAVAKLVEQIGAEAVDAGPLLVARYVEPTGMLVVQLAYLQGLGARSGLSFIREGSEN